MASHTRELTGIEKVIWMMSRRVPLNFVVAARLGGVVDREALNLSVRRLRRSHRGLAARISTDKSGKVFLISDDEVPDFAVTEHTDPTEEAWCREAERQLAEPFDLSKGPLARFVAIRLPDSIYLLAVCYHGIADGHSGVTLLRDVCLGMIADQSERQAAALPPGLTQALPNAVKTAASVRSALAWGRGLIGFFRAWGSVQRRLFGPPYLSRFPKNAPLPAIQQRMESRGLSVRAWSLPPEATEGFIKRCRANATTVHAAVCVAAARAVHAQGRGHAKRHVQTPVNVRHRLSPDLDEVAGLYMVQCHLQVDGAPEADFWAVARDLSATLRRRTTSPDLFTGALFVDALLANNDEDFLRLTTARAEQAKFPHDIAISNLGLSQLAVEIGQFQIEHLYGPAVAGRLGGPVLGVATHNQRMTFTLTSQTPNPFPLNYDALRSNIERVLTY